MNPFSFPDPWSAVSDGYSKTTMMFLSRYAQTALESIPLTSDWNVLDIACGPGTVSRLIHHSVAHIHAIDFSPDMLRILTEYLRQNSVANVEPHLGDAQWLPYSDYTFDLAISMFGLMFFPDRSRGFAEAFRVLKPGGKIMVSSWAPVKDSPAMTLMFGAIAAMNPTTSSSSESVENLENPAVFEKEMRQAGFHNIRISRITHYMEAESIVQFWEDMESGSAPFVMLKQKWGDKLWAEKKEIGLAYCQNYCGTGPIRLSSDAWLGIGEK